MQERSPIAIHQHNLAKLVMLQAPFEVTIAAISLPITELTLAPLSIPFDGGPVHSTRTPPQRVMLLITISTTKQKNSQPL